MIVVDASVLVDALLQAPEAKPLGAWLYDPDKTLHAPHLIDIEVAHVIRRHTAAGTISATFGRAVLADLEDFPLRRYPHDVLLPSIWELRQNFTAYDAAYVALARGLEASLLTRDARLAAAVRRHTRIVLI